MLTQVFDENLSDTSIWTTHVQSKSNKIAGFNWNIPYNVFILHDSNFNKKGLLCQDTLIGNLLTATYMTQINLNEVDMKNWVQKFCQHNLATVQSWYSLRKKQHEIHVVNKFTQSLVCIMST